jgi:heptosyltransferase-1
MGPGGFFCVAIGVFLWYVTLFSILEERKRGPLPFPIDNVERILIVRLSAIGDVVRTLVALPMIRARFPKAHIAWVVEEKARDILMYQSALDEVIVFPKKSLLRKAKNPLTLPSAVAQAVRFVRGLRERRFDVALDFHGILKSGIISRLSGAPVRFGYEKGFSKEMNHLFNNRRIGLPARKLSRVERNLALARALCGDAEAPVTRLMTGEKDRAAVRKILAGKAANKRPRIIVHPGTSERTAYKRWDTKKFAAAADLILDRLGGEVIVSWGPGEEAIASAMARSMRHRPLLLPGPLPLATLAELYRTADLYVGGDTGTTHISSFVGTPVVVVFGPTDPIENEPYVKTPFRMVRAASACSPCREKGCRRTDCFDRVTPEMVADAAESLIGPKKRTSPDAP